jgi:hypothetical protein
MTSAERGALVALNRSSNELSQSGIDDAHLTAVTNAVAEIAAGWAPDVSIELVRGPDEFVQFTYSC